MAYYIIFNNHWLLLWQKDFLYCEMSWEKEWQNNKPKKTALCLFTEVEVSSYIYFSNFFWEGQGG